MITAALILLLSSVAAQAPSGSYAPSYVQCPSATDTLFRLAGTTPQGNQTISSQEQAYIQARKAVAEPLWQQYLGARNTGYDASSFGNASAWPTLAMAVSGGGYRASLYGAGMMSGFDSRNTTAEQMGTGGLLQLANYITGLSGGSWAVSSWAIHNGIPFTELVLGGDSTPGWQLQYNLILPGGLLSPFDNSDYYDNLQADVDLKEQAGFNTSLTDIWGRGLSYHFGTNTAAGEDAFFNRANDGANSAALLFDQIRDQSEFINHNMPFPIIVADSVLDNQSVQGNPLTEALVLLNQTVFEFNPYEFGSYDAFLSAFVNLTYLGTEIDSGSPVDASRCVEGFDNFGFLIGTSSSLFNAIFTGVLGGQVDGFVSAAFQSILSKLLDSFTSNDNDVAIYPNPFQGINPGQFARADSRVLNLVDGGLNGENIPFAPLLAQARGVDVIMAMDGSADTDQNYPNGTAMVTTYQRTQLPDLAESYQFPQVPLEASTWVDQGLNVRPTVFGCDANTSVPLVIYLPNSPLPGVEGSTGTSTIKLDYSVEEAASFLDQAQRNAYKGIVDQSAAEGTRDEQWPDCLACVVLDRARERAGVSRSSTCETCFSRYCWNGQDTGNTNAQVTSTANDESSAMTSAAPLGLLALAGGLAML